MNKRREMDKLYERYKNFLTINNYYILTQLDIKGNPGIIDYLLEKEVLTEYHKQNIESHPKNFQKASYLMDVLLKRHPDVLENFLEALNVGGQSYIQKTLLTCLDGLETNDSFTEAEAENIDVMDFSGNIKETIKKTIMIVNNDDFNSNDLKRSGSIKDTEDLQEFFVDKLGYDLYNKKPFYNLGARQILTEMEKFSALLIDFEKKFDKCIAIIVVMSHGVAGKVYGTDEQWVEVFRILDCFKYSNENVSKAFIFSCCRGGINSLASKSDNKSSDFCSVSDAIAKGRVGNSMSWKHAPPRSMVLYSTQLDYVSYREGEGTIYVQALLSVLRNHYQTHTLRDMVMMVKTEMHSMFPKYAQYPDIKENCFRDLKL